jgi:ATP-dependent protease HslVU (ClpYQ) peptidase subunit
MDAIKKCRSGRHDLTPGNLITLKGNNQRPRCRLCWEETHNRVTRQSARVIRRLGVVGAPLGELGLSELSKLLEQFEKDLEWERKSLERIRKLAAVHEAQDKMRVKRCLERIDALDKHVKKASEIYIKRANSQGIF